MDVMDEKTSKKTFKGIMIRTKYLLVLTVSYPLVLKRPKSKGL